MEQSFDPAEVNEADNAAFWHATMEAQMQAKRDKANALAAGAPLGPSRKAINDNIAINVYPHGGEGASNLPLQASHLVNDGPANPIIQAIWNSQHFLLSQIIEQ